MTSFLKFPYVRSDKLMRAYGKIPCQHCGADDGTVVGAHSNWSCHGKGRGIKARDVYCASSISSWRNSFGTAAGGKSCWGAGLFGCASFRRRNTGGAWCLNCALLVDPYDRWQEMPWCRLIDWISSCTSSSKSMSSSRLGTPHTGSECWTFMAYTSMTLTACCISISLRLST